MFLVEQILPYDRAEGISTFHVKHRTITQVHGYGTSARRLELVCKEGAGIYRAEFKRHQSSSLGGRLDSSANQNKPA
jgi:hypothetical protein